MKMTVKDTIHVLGAILLILWSSADLLHTENNLDRRGDPLQVAQCSVYLGQAQLPHT